MRSFNYHNWSYGIAPLGRIAAAEDADANLTDTSEVVEIDAKTASVARRWSTAPCKQPVAMAIDTAHHRLFSGCRSDVMAVSDYQAGKVVAVSPT